MIPQKTHKNYIMIISDLELWESFKKIYKINGLGKNINQALFTLMRNEIETTLSRRRIRMVDKEDERVKLERDKIARERERVVLGRLEGTS